MKNNFREESSNPWFIISKGLNKCSGDQGKLRNFILYNRDTIYNLELIDITLTLQPASILNKFKKAGDNFLKELLNAWDEHKQLKGIVSYVLRKGSTQEISNTLNALKGTSFINPDIIKAEDLKPSVAEVFCKGNSQNISNTLNALKGTSFINPDIIKAEDLKLAIEEVFREGNAQEIANTLNALKGTGFINPDIINAEDLKSAVAEAFREGNAQNISNTLNALKGTSFINSNIINAEDLKSGVAEVFREGEAQAISNTLNALKGTSFKIEDIIKAEDLKSSVAEVFHEGNAQGIANTLNALKGTGFINPDIIKAEHLKLAVAEVFSKRNAQGIANTLNALKGTSFINPDIIKTEDLKSAVAEVFREGNAQGIANTLNALKGTGFINPDIIKAEHLKLAVAEVFSKRNAQGIANTLNALKGTSFKIEDIIKAEDLKPAVAEVFRKGNSQEISNTLNALKGTSFKIEDIIKAEDLKSAVAEVFHEGNAQEIANTLNALKGTSFKIEDIIKTEDLKSAVAEAFREGNAQNISNTLNALKGTSFKNEDIIKAEDLKPAVAEVFRKGNAQDISNTLNALKGTSFINSDIINLQDLKEAIQKVLMQGSIQNISHIIDAIKNINYMSDELTALMQRYLEITRAELASGFEFEQIMRSHSFLMYNLRDVQDIVLFSQFYNSIKEEFVSLIKTLWQQLPQDNVYFYLINLLDYDDQDPEIIFIIKLIIRTRYEILAEGNSIDTIIELSKIITLLLDYYDNFPYELDQYLILYNQLLENPDLLDSKNIDYLDKLISYAYQIRLNLKQRNILLEVSLANDLLNKLEKLFQHYTIYAKDIDQIGNLNQLLFATILEPVELKLSLSEAREIEQDFDTWLSTQYNSKHKKRKREDSKALENKRAKIERDDLGSEMDVEESEIISDTDSSLFLEESYDNDLLTSIKVRNSGEIKSISLQEKSYKLLYSNVEEDKVKKTNAAHLLLGKEADEIVYVNLKRGEGLAKQLFKVHRYERELYLTGIAAGNSLKGKIELENYGQIIGFKLDNLYSNSFTKQFLSEVGYREGFYYINRALFASSVNNQVLHGSFNLYRAAEGYKICSSLPFIVQDGCGYIKADLLTKLVKFSSSNSQPPYITYQALQELKGDEKDEKYVAAVTDAADKGLKYINEASEFSARRLYAAMTTGNPDGFTKIAVPINSEANDEVLIGDSVIAADKALVIGRSPYDKFNIYAPKFSYAPEVATAYGIQYSLTGSEEQRGVNALSFYKGVLIAIDSKYWPQELSDVDIITSSEDRKIYSHASSRGGLKPEAGSYSIMHGVLTPTEIYQKGSLIGVKPNIQKACGGDYDGDPVICQVYDKQSSVYNLIKGSDEKFFKQNPKLPKTFTPERDNLMRAGEILSLKQDNLLEGYTYLYNIYVALRVDYQLEIANRVIKDASVQNLINIIAQENQAEGFVQLSPEDQLLYILSKGIKLGTDSFKTSIDKLPYQQLLRKMQSIFNKENIPVPFYFKSMCKQIEKAYEEEVGKVSPGKAVAYIAKQIAQDLAPKLEAQQKYFAGSFVNDVTSKIAQALASDVVIKQVHRIEYDNPLLNNADAATIKAMLANKPTVKLVQDEAYIRASYSLDGIKISSKSCYTTLIEYFRQNELFANLVNDMAILPDKKFFGLLNENEYEVIQLQTIAARTGLNIIVVSQFESNNQQYYTEQSYGREGGEKIYIWADENGCSTYIDNALPDLRNFAQQELWNLRNEEALYVSPEIEYSMSVSFLGIDILSLV
jgi:hypothetical protein